MRHILLSLTLVIVLVGAWWALPDASRPVDLAPGTATTPSEGAHVGPVLEEPVNMKPGAGRVGSRILVPASVSGMPRDVPLGPPALTFDVGGSIPDPIQVGACALLLRIVDRQSGEPVAGTATLWRLDAPASEHWGRGDQAQYCKEITKEGGLFENLATGTYRAVCHVERNDASDPQAFRVDGSLSEVTLEVVLPMERSARALLFDEDGTPIREAEMRGGSRSWTSSVVGTREWVRERASLVSRTKPATYLTGGGGGGGAFSSHSHWKWKTVSPTEQGFELGHFVGDQRDRVQTHRVELRLADGREAKISVHGAHRGERLYVSVFPRHERVLDSLVLPNGGTGWDIVDEVSIEGHEILASEALTDSPWLEVPISVFVHHPDYETVSFTYKLGDGPLELRRLELRRSGHQKQ